MTEEPQPYQYQIFLLNGLSFQMTSPEPYQDFLKTTLVQGYVMTNTDFAPYHAIAVIRVAHGIPAAGAADLRSLN
jgi:hypothetical protein